MSHLTESTFSTCCERYFSQHGEKHVFSSSLKGGKVRISNLRWEKDSEGQIMFKRKILKYLTFGISRTRASSMRYLIDLIVSEKEKKSLKGCY